jgi:2-hydroxy-6-oxonona-2,4-dienedioate hydrolase
MALGITPVAQTFWNSLLGAETRYYDAGGIRTRSIQAGDGEPVLLLHGIGATAETFAYNVIPLSECFDVRTIDLLAHGLTATCEGALTKERFAQHVVDYLDAAGIKRAHLVGLSLGGWLATWTSLLHPERVAKVVNVVGAHFAVPTDEEQRRKAQAGRDDLVRLTRQFVAEPTRENLRARLAWTFHAPDQQITEEFVDLRWELQRRSTTGKQIGALVGNPSVEDLLTPERLSTVTRATLVLWTDHNPSTTAVEAKAAAACIPGGDFALMTDCGHWPQWESPTIFNRIVTDFLNTGR